MTARRAYPPAPVDPEIWTPASVREHRKAIKEWQAECRAIDTAQVSTLTDDFGPKTGAISLLQRPMFVYTMARARRRRLLADRRMQLGELSEAEYLKIERQMEGVGKRMEHAEAEISKIMRNYYVNRAR